MPTSLRSSTLAGLLVLGLGTSALIGAAPAGAATSGDTTLTVDLQGGLLSISSPATATATGSVAAGSTVNVSLSETTVSDARGSLLGWTVTGSATDLSTGSGGPNRTVPKAAMVWTTGSITAVAGSATGVTPGTPGSMAAPWVVAAAVPTAGAGTYTYPSTVAITVPPDLYAGSYTGTITQSVA